MKKLLDILAWTPLGFIIVPILIRRSSYLDGWLLYINGAVMGLWALIIIALFTNLTKC